MGKQVGSDGSPKIPFDGIIEDAPVAIFVKDLDGRYLYVNTHYEIVTGISSEEALGRTEGHLFPPAVAAIYRQNSLRTVETMSALRFEEPLRVAGSERLFSTVNFPILGEGKAVATCGMSIDITDVPHDDGNAKGERETRAEAFFGRLLDTLTPQEVRVLDHVAAGFSDKEIAEKLNLSGDTVRHHVSHLLKKLRKRRGQVIIEMLKRDRR